MARLGLIPARAGNTIPSCRHSIRTWAHPRSRGEHDLFSMLFGLNAGSSPLARGTHRERKSVRLNDGLIPARAGNTSAPTLSTRRLWAHPRSRGEHIKLEIASTSILGSSPLARGTPKLSP